jgi:hypothetical protein
MTFPLEMWLDLLSLALAFIFAPKSGQDSFQPRLGDRQITLAGLGRLFLETVEYVNPVPDLCEIDHPIPGSLILLSQLIYSGSDLGHRAAVQRSVAYLQPP